ncbi:NADH-quinone oxidoreductase subunit M [Halarchaeum solikamskense]|uniref:complex I subunit 4 family protein n=1 Tax=Halarchaeum nitratireducens TaxID=489913 RepID=UPI001B3A9CFF|nr:NADH-quinone oxidoreductase subunit M [Halarchaeum solikamskense]MBP2250837.1 NADH-quinone oxidoreductase subunit M [Halarchaeum solikamskense]
MLVEALLAVTFVAAFAVLLAPARYAGRLAAVLSLVPLVGIFYAYTAFDGTENALLGGTPAFETVVPWVDIGGYAIDWHVGLDGISLPLVVLTAVLTTVAIVAARGEIGERRSLFYALLLFTEASLIGVFSALDFFLWFVFWEFVLVPMYLLVAVYGGPRRRYAAIKFFVYTNVASLVLFVGFVMLVVATPVESFGLAAVAEAVRSGAVTGAFGLSASTLTGVAFLALFFGFAVKSAFVPFHTWLPDAYTEAPTPVTVLLAGVVTKMGTYSLLRFNVTMFPDLIRQWALPLALVAVLTVLYGSLAALAQRDAKRLVAYTSIPSMGFVLLGSVAATNYGLAGATFQMVSHGLLVSVLFLAVGYVEDATGTRMINKLSGLADRLPVTATVLVAGAFGYMGLPLMSGFAGEFFVFTGSFAAPYPHAQLVTAAAMFGIVVVAGYLLRLLQGVLMGPFEAPTTVTPRSRRDLAPAVALVLLSIYLGVAPGTLMGAIQDAVGAFVAVFGGGL